MSRILLNYYVNQYINGKINLENLMDSVEAQMIYEINAE